MSRYLLTGATGFLGRHVAEALLARGHQVVAVAR
ncbi:MAG: NAD-dependent epimerase/dehydratase family protein, partial [Polyangiaceae bacterium]|nr:NAD-dependent epimerase/dehydratase family protein [Polyangiaceae bacterium]